MRSINNWRFLCYYFTPRCHIYAQLCLYARTMFYISSLYATFFTTVFILCSSNTPYNIEEVVPVSLNLYHQSLI